MIESIDVEKPTADQVAWVFSKLREHAIGGGTFRYLIYDRMGYEPSDYAKLYEAGGMMLSNMINAFLDVGDD